MEVSANMPESTACEVESLYVEGLRMADLRFGASFLIWGFRHCAAGAAACPVARRSYEMAFEGDEQALVQLEMLTTAIGETGRRRIWFAPPSCERLTQDEACLLEVLEAAQAQQFARLDDRLCELLAGAPSNLVRRCAHALALLFRARGFHIIAPVDADDRYQDHTVANPLSKMMH
ncbi:MAG: hypothetical protein AAF184_24445 [Pseudomonadota bacterium]